MNNIPIWNVRFELVQTLSLRFENGQTTVWTSDFCVYKAITATKLILFFHLHLCKFNQRFFNLHKNEMVDFFQPHTFSVWFAFKPYAIQRSKEKSNGIDRIVMELYTFNILKSMKPVGNCLTNLPLRKLETEKSKLKNITKWKHFPSPHLAI